MALKVEDMYWRLFFDSKLKIYTLTCIPLSSPTHQPVVSSHTVLKELTGMLTLNGYSSCQRAAFELLVRQSRKVTS